MIGLGEAPVGVGVRGCVGRVCNEAWILVRRATISLLLIEWLDDLLRGLIFFRVKVGTRAVVSCIYSSPLWFESTSTIDIDSVMGLGV